ncbi:MAG: TetR family transcriptional regulator [Methanomicrobiales archaeon]|nr:TetR family transcriptional regulator [Methanomicrobiales archaeon]
MYQNLFFKGYLQVTIGGIAKEAGISRLILCLYFRDKEGSSRPLSRFSYKRWEMSRKKRSTIHY